MLNSSKHGKVSDVTYYKCGLPCSLSIVYYEYNSFNLLFLAACLHSSHYTLKYRVLFCVSINYKGVNCQKVYFGS